MGLPQLQAKPLKPALFEMDGISRNQIEQHYTLYQGYVNKVNEIRQKLETADRSAANQTYSEIRELKVELSFALDGVKLHEAYFDNLGGKGGQPTGEVADAINREFGSFEKWAEDFKASGISARGWVVLAYDMENDTLFNYIADDHNTYGIWNAIAILVLDTYEHAYMIDYGVKRPPYIDAFMRNIDWSVVEDRLKKAKARKL